jgi:acetyl esterase/lipase
MRILLLLKLGFFLSSISLIAQEKNDQWLNVNYADDAQVYHNLDIHLPQKSSATYKPIIVIYGSAWFGNNFKHAAFEALGKPLLERGFAVIAINHRSSMDAAYPAQIHDVKAAIRFIRSHAKQYRLDTSFIGITGFSSGGHLAALAGASNGVKSFTVGKTTIDVEGSVGKHTDVSSDVHAVVDWFGPIDLMRMVDCKTPKDEKSPEGAMIKGNPADIPDLTALLSPLTYLDKHDPPFLVIHGVADEVVPFCQSELFATALKEKGLLTELIPVAGGQHGPITFNEQTLARMGDFFVERSNRK